MIADAIRSLGPWAWIVLGLALVGVELLAPGVFFIWLGLAALATGLLDAVLDLSWQASALLFAMLCVVAVLAGRALTRPRLQPDTTADFLNRRGQALVGRVFVLETPIKDGEGRIRVDDTSWRVTGADRFAGARVRVVRVEGATLVVDDP
ncbi:NfeD family protein [Microvirga thermotolerans]|uniref:NfeD family protein n=1 Tax=Microvirga thermotolerans TaxID=2651334 RepID=A0A5P9JS09_9HYPH|nr:NfeD family protein [Microvirga thermotolerans]QFU15407.1 NfeD family protein [Microvirga thermotolerans]